MAYLFLCPDVTVWADRCFVADAGLLHKLHALLHEQSLHPECRTVFSLLRKINFFCILDEARVLLIDCLCIVLRSFHILRMNSSGNV